MSKNKNRSGANTLSSFSTVVGITLVLSMLGALFIILLVANSVTKHFKEQLIVQLFLKEGVEENEVLRFKKEIEAYDYSGEVKYTSAEEAAASMQQELGEEFVEFLGYNPLPASIDIQINPDFAELESLESKISTVAQNDLVDEVVYQKGLLQMVNENISKWSLGLLIVGVLFLIIAVVLIVNTIELAIFSQRFIIKSMQLVGATHWFIQKPFMRKGLIFGLLASIFALAIISGILYYYQNPLADVIQILADNNQFLILIGAVVATGLLVSWLATAYAVRRFIRINQNDLY